MHYVIEMFLEISENFKGSFTMSSTTDMLVLLLLAVSKEFDS